MHSEKSRDERTSPQRAGHARENQEQQKGKRGLTYTAVRRFLDQLQAQGDVQGEIVFLSDYKVGVCRGCKACFERGE